MPRSSRTSGNETTVEDRAGPGKRNPPKKLFWERDLCFGVGRRMRSIFDASSWWGNPFVFWAG